MSTIIKQIWKKIKTVWELMANDFIFSLSLMFLVALSSFILGGYYFYQEERLKNELKFKLIKNNENKIYYLASKKGKRYYLPWCYTGSEKNKIIFKTKKEAEQAGYTPSKNCEGL